MTTNVTSKSNNVIKDLPNLKQDVRSLDSEIDTSDQLLKDLPLTNFKNSQDILTNEHSLDDPNQFNQLEFTATEMDDVTRE